VRTQFFSKLYCIWCWRYFGGNIFTDYKFHMFFENTVHRFWHSFFSRNLVSTTAYIQRVSEITTLILNFNQWRIPSRTTKLLCNIFSNYNFHFGILLPHKLTSCLFSSYLTQWQWPWNNSFCKIGVKHCVFTIKFFRCTAEVDTMITFSVSFVKLQKTDIYVLILWFELKFCESGAFIFE
jgi:hypothetical protein